MNVSGWQVLLLGAVIGLSGCQRTRETRPAKAVPLRSDGVLDLRLMSFNVRYENAEDWGQRAWRERVSGIVRMIRQQRPDCIGVQEALHGQAADLWSSLPDYEFFGVGRNDGLRDGEYSGIFYQNDRFQRDQGDSGTFWLSDHPTVPGSKTWGNEIPRVAAWVRLVDRGTGRGFYLFNTHWDHRNQESREHAAKLIAMQIDRRKHLDEPVALVGDFNSVESNPAMTYLTGRVTSLVGAQEFWKNGLVDAYKIHHAGEKNRRTLHFWKGNRDGAVKVDHILVSHGATVESAEILSNNKPMVSDHFPVTARVLFAQGRVRPID